MCNKRDIDEVLRQLKDCREADHQRRLLEGAVPCRICPEALKGEDRHEPGCHCRQLFRAELQNYVYTITR